MKKIIIPIIALSACFLSGCSRLEMEQVEDVVVPAGTTVFTAIYENTSSKTVLTGPDGERNYPVYWSAGDKIKIFTQDSEPGAGSEFSLISGAGTVQATFNGELNASEEGVYYYAIYPHTVAASSLSTDKRHISFFLPQVQKYETGSFAQRANPAIAITNNTTLRFKNVCGLLKTSITSGDGLKVKRIKIRDIKQGGTFVSGGERNRLWGTVDVNVDNINECSIKNIGVWGTTILQNEVYLECETPVTLTSTPTDFYIVLPVNTLNAGFELTVYDENGVVIYFRRTEEDNTIHRSMVREMPVINIGSNTLTNLSANGTANSYIAAPGGDYSFYALQKGNGNYPISGADNVVVLFETRNASEPISAGDVIKNVSYNSVTGNISFTTVNSGNASIAIRNSLNEILWSWHIWVTDYNPETTYVVYPGTTAKVMTRNLGALHNTANSLGALGLNYQWGRKDPEIGYKDNTRKQNTESETFTVYTTYPKSVFDEAAVPPEERPIDFSVKHPCTHIIGDAQWEDPALGWSDHGRKTFTDPCPPGWKVMDAETVFYSDYFNPNTGNFYYAAKSGDGDTVGWTIKDKNNSNSIYFATLRGDLYWTNFWGQGLAPSTFRFSTGYRNPYASADLPLRCQKEGTGYQEHYTNLSSSGTSNCYIVNEVGRYKFKADVKGNSTESIGSPAKVDVIWQSDSGVTNSDEKNTANPLMYGPYSLPNVRYSDGYIYFQTEWAFIPGSAVVALKDSDDRVLWSWHLWFTNYKPDENYATIDGGDSDPSRRIMKYNLGAVPNDKGSAGLRGMMYQWGRKDPFFGAATSSGTVPAQGGEHGQVITSAANGTVRYSIQNPGTIIKGQESEYDWMHTPDNSLWGAAKTKYDPCPPGWKVPSRPVWATPIVVAGETSDYGITMQGVWYPAAGYRGFGNGNLDMVGTEGHYWYSTAKNDGDAYSSYFNIGTGTEAIDLTNHSDHKAQLNSVRCVRE